MNIEPMDTQEARTLDAALVLLRKRLHERFQEHMEPEEYARLRADLDKAIEEAVETELRADLRESLDRVEQRVARRCQARLKREHREQEEWFQRFDIHMRLQHMMMFTSVITLAITGMPLKFPHFVLSEGVIAVLGGVRHAGLLHRAAALLLIAAAVYHVIYTIVSPSGRRDFLLLLPRPQDALDAVQRIKLYLGLTDEPPKFGRFSYIEKFDYWAVYWGCVIMIGSGSILWGNEIALKYLPLYWTNIAKIAHSDEALLATLALVIWHFYNVHFNPDTFPGSLTWWHGKIDKHHMLEHHALEYERIMAERREQAAKGEG